MIRDRGERSLKPSERWAIDDCAGDNYLQVISLNLFELYSGEGTFWSYW